MAGLAFEVLAGKTEVALAGGDFRLTVNGRRQSWPAANALTKGDAVVITPGKSGNYGYLRFNGEVDVPKIIGSRSTNTIVALGGWNGRALRTGDELALIAAEAAPPALPDAAAAPAGDGAIRFVWGLHADRFSDTVREGFCAAPFVVSRRFDRMGVRLEDKDKVFGQSALLSLVSDSVVPGDIQILGDGTPIVLMRDHQPTGGYARIATVISADLDRFAQLRPGTKLRFAPVSVSHARQLLRRGQ
jgi:allophanate hydrolase